MRRQSQILPNPGAKQIALDLNGMVRENLKHTLCYLEDKKGLMAALQYLVFSKHIGVPDALHGDLLKQAFTALSFGARTTANAWVAQNCTTCSIP